MSAHHVYLSLLRFALELLQKKACFWLYYVKPFSRPLLTDLELVLWSSRVVALDRYTCVLRPPASHFSIITVILLFCCGPPLLDGSSSIR